MSDPLEEKCEFYFGCLDQPNSADFFNPKGCTKDYSLRCKRYNQIKLMEKEIETLRDQGADTRTNRAFLKKVMAYQFLTRKEFPL